MYYQCVGKTHYYEKLGFPQYKGPNNVSKFIDYKDWMPGYKKTPSELGVPFPPPEQFRDADGRLWLLRHGDIGVDGNKPFTSEARHGAEAVGDWSGFKPQVKEKTYDPNLSWAFQWGNTWQSLKRRGFLK